MGIGVAELALAVLGVMMVSAEYPTGLIWVTLSAVPHRGRLLAAKTAVFALVGLVIGEVLSFAAFVIGQLVISGTAPTAALGQPGVLRAVAGTGLFLALIGVLGVAVGALVRSTTAGVAGHGRADFRAPGTRAGAAGNVAEPHAQVLAHPGGRLRCRTWRIKRTPSGRGPGSGSLPGSRHS